MAMDIGKVVRSSPFFAGLSDDACRALAAVCQRRRIRRRAMLFMQDEPGEAMYVLLIGAVQLLKTNAAGDAVVIRTVRPGENFAEAILFEQDRYPVTAVALSESQVLWLPRAEVLRLLDDPGFRGAFVRMLLARLRYLADRLAHQAVGGVEDRLFGFLAEHYGRRPLIRVDITKKSIAAAIGIAPETLSRAIGRLRRRRLLRWDGQSLRVADAAWTKWAS
jgi:CRP-like cAMP-binding protein